MTKPLVMVGLALVFGALAVFVSQRWIERQAEAYRRQAPVAQSETVPTSTVVVAAAPLRFGTELSPQHLREVPWPEGAKDRS